MKIIGLFILWLFSQTCLAQPLSSPVATIAHCPVAGGSKPASTQLVDAPPNTADLDSVLAAVSAALKCYQDNRGEGPDALPPLQQAQFDFKTTTGKVGGLTVSFFIFKFGASVESDTANQLSFVYALPNTGGEGHALKIEKPPQPLADALVADMQSAAAAVKLRAQLDKLTSKKLSVTLQYGILFDGNVGVNVPIQLVTVGANYDRKRNDVQTVTLTFSNPDSSANKKNP